MATKKAAKKLTAPGQGETLGQRLARLRKERGYTQVELAEKMGVVQTIISDHERGKLRPNPDLLVQYATALEVSTDVILGITAPAKTSAAHNRRFLRRLQAIDQLPKRDQEALLRTIDAFLAKSKAS